jgi:hypothetical protein
MPLGIERGAVRLVAITSLAAVAMIIPPSAGAAVTIGQTGTPDITCSPFDRVQPTVLAGNSYVVPPTIASGRITSWSAQGGATPATMGMKVFKSLGGLTYQVVGHDGPFPLTPNAQNRFPTNIAVKAGDILGDFNTATTDPICTFTATGETYPRFAGGTLSDGSSADFTVFSGDRRLNVSAVIEPTNTFSVGAAALNKKKGTATVPVTVPNPGTLALSGGGSKPQAASGPIAAKAVSAPGTVSLLVKAQGKKKKTKLRTKGKVKVSPTITFTPTDGTARSQTVTIKLQKKLKKG